LPSLSSIAASSVIICERIRTIETTRPLRIAMARSSPAAALAAHRHCARADAAPILQVQSLRIENQGAFVLGQLEVVDHADRAGGIVGGIHPSRHRWRQFHPLAQCVRAGRSDRPQGHAQPVERFGVFLAVEQVDRFIIAAQALDRSGACRHGVSAREQRLRFGELAKVGALQRRVHEELDTIDRHIALRRLPLVQRFEIGGSIGIVARIVPAIAFGQGRGGIERERLDAGIGFGIVDRRRGDLDRFVQRLVRHDRPDRQRKRAVIRRETFYDIGHLAAIGAQDFVTEFGRAPAAVLARPGSRRGRQGAVQSTEARRRSASRTAGSPALFRSAKT
jgi:hypothetical protein